MRIRGRAQPAHGAHARSRGDRIDRMPGARGGAGRQRRHHVGGAPTAAAEPARARRRRQGARRLRARFPDLAGGLQQHARVRRRWTGAEARDAGRVLARGVKGSARSHPRARVRTERRRRREHVRTGDPRPRMPGAARRHRRPCSLLPLDRRVSHATGVLCWACALIAHGAGFSQGESDASARSISTRRSIAQLAALVPRAFDSPCEVTTVCPGSTPKRSR